MNRILIIYLILFSVFVFCQSSNPLQTDSTEKKQQIIIQDTIAENPHEENDTSTLQFDTTELNIPLNQNNLTKVIFVKEKSKVDWIKYLLPIFTLFLGIGVKELIEKHSNKKKIKKAGERWIAELRSLKEPLEKQIESLEEFLEEHEKENFLTPRLEIYSSLNGEIFKSLDKNELIKFIELNNSNEEFNEVVKISNRCNGYISILIHLHENIQEKFKQYLTGTSTHTTSLSQSLQSFNSAFRDYGVELEKELNSDPYTDPRYKPIADLYSAQIIPKLMEGDFNPFILEKDFFIPLLDILKDLRLDIRTKELASAMTSGFIAIKGIKLEKQYMSENVKTVIKHYKVQLTELDEVINEIE